MTTKSLLPIVALTAMWAASTTPEPAAPPVSLVGITVPSQVAKVAPEQAGKIVAVPVEDGDPVAAGDVLFQLNSVLEQLEVDRLQALVDSNLFERRANTTLAYARLQAERVRDLRDQDISSERDLQVYQHELELAELKVEQAELDKAQARNSLAQAQERLTQRTVRSPFAGIVTQRLQSNGEAVEKFVPVVEVMSLDPLWIEFECPITEQHLFQRGGTASVAPAVRPDDRRTATILVASSKATASSHSFMVRAWVPNKDLSWKTGQKMVIEPDENHATPSGGK